MADPTISLTMPQESLDLMLPPIKAYIAVPFKTGADGEVLKDANGNPTNELVDDLSYIKWLAQEHLEGCFTKGTIILANAAAKAAIDKAKVEAIKAANLKEKE